MQDVTGGSEEERDDPGWHDVVDFSSCFEDTVLTSIPPLFILIFGLFRILELRKTKQYLLDRVPTSTLYLTKQARALSLGIAMSQRAL